MKAWYDFFSLSYDASVAHLYDEARQAAVEAMRLAPGQTVLDAPCGTGLSFPFLAEGLGHDGHILGADLSTGMLKRARKKADGLTGVQVELLQGDLLALAPGLPEVDAIQIFLGLTAMDHHEQVVRALWDRLRPGGRFVIVDVHADKLSLQGRMVQFTARANLRRTPWTTLQALAPDFTREALASSWQVGGQLYCASGTKPADA